MSSLLFELSSHAQGQNSFAELLCKLLAFVITHYTSQTVPFDGPFCLLSAVPGPWTMGLAVPGKAAQKGCYGTGMRNSPYCLTEEALNHAESSKWSYPVAPGTPCHLLVPRAVLKETEAHLGEFAVGTTAKPQVSCKPRLPEIEQAQQCSSTCIPYPVPRVLLLCGSSVGSAEGRGCSIPLLSQGWGAGRWVRDQLTFSLEVPALSHWWLVPGLADRGGVAHPEMLYFLPNH